MYTTNYKPTINQHDGLIIIENVLTLLSCIYVQKYNYFLCLIDYAFTQSERELEDATMDEDGFQ